MQIGLASPGVGRPGHPSGPAAPGLGLLLSPATPAAGDLVTLTGAPWGMTTPQDFATLAVTIGGTAVSLAGNGLRRTFIARAGALAVSAGVTAAEGSASASLSVAVPARITAASVSGFGSSSMEGDGASSSATTALALMAGASGATTTRNKGLGGTVLQNSPDASGAPRANNGRDRFAADLLGANRTARLFILYGANDLRYTGAPATFNLAGFGNDFREIMNGLLLGGYAPADIVIGSPNWYPDTTYSVGSTGFTGSNRTVHEAHVAECRAIAAEYGTPYADVYAKMRDLGGTSLMSSDGLHANDAGHQVIAHAFLTAEPVNGLATVVPGAMTAPAAGTLSLAWTEVQGAIDYSVEVGLSGSHVFAGQVAASGGLAQITGLAPGTYVARIRANFAQGSGPWRFWTTPVAVGGTQSATVPAAFGSADWSVASGSAAGEIVLTVSALPSNGGSALTALQYALDGGTVWTALAGTGTGARTLTMAAPATGYSFLLRAVNAVGAGAASAAKTATSGVAGAGTGTPNSPVVTGRDTFAGRTAGALLSSLTPELGAWTIHPQTTLEGAISTDQAGLRGPSTTSKFCIGLLAAEPVAGGVFVEMDMVVRSNNAQLTTYAVARTASDSLTFIAAGYNGSAWRILKYVAGTVTVVGTYSLTETVGATPTMRLEVEAGVQRLYRNGTLLVTTSITDAELGTPGNGLGLRLGAGSTSWSASGSNGAPVTAIRAGRLTA